MHCIRREPVPVGGCPAARSVPHRLSGRRLPRCQRMVRRRPCRRAVGFVEDGDRIRRVRRATRRAAPRRRHLGRQCGCCPQPWLVRLGDHVRRSGRRSAESGIAGRRRRHGRERASARSVARCARRSPRLLDGRRSLGPTLAAFIDGSSAWLDVERRNGPDAAADTWFEVLAGQVAPSVGRITSLHAD